MGKKKTFTIVLGTCLVAKRWKNAVSDKGFNTLQELFVLIQDDHEHYSYNYYVAEIN